MKKIFTILCLLVAGNLFSQFDDTLLYTKYPGIYGLQYPRVMMTKVLRPPSDTIYTKTGLAIKNGNFYYGDGVMWHGVAAGGTVTTFSAGNLSPLFTTSVSNASTSPALSFTLSNAAALTVFGNNTGSSAAPGFFLISSLGFITDVSSNNGITENTTNNFQLGGTLIQTTKFTMGGNTVEYEGGRVFMDDTRFMFNKGGNVASTGNLTLGAVTNGNAYNVTGDVQINAMTTTNWQEGSLVWLHFEDTLTIKNNTTGGAGTAPFMLSGGADFTTDSTTVLSLLYINGKWNEVSRKQLQGSFIENRTTVQTGSNFFISGTGRTATTGYFSSPGAGSGSEKFGLNTAATGANGIAVGNSATVSTGIAICPGCSAGSNIIISKTPFDFSAFSSGVTVGGLLTGSSGVSIGGGSSAGTNAFAGGGNALASASGSISLGTNSQATAANATAINAVVAFANSIGIQGNPTGASQFVVGRDAVPIPDIYPGGDGVLSTTPDNVILHATGGSGSNVIGASMYFASGIATGNAVGGVLYFQTSTVGVSGSTAQTLATRVIINGTGINLPNGVMPTTGSGGTDSAVFRNSSNGQYFLAPASSGSGSVTSFTFTDGSGFDGTVTNSTSTPTLALTTTVTDTRVMYSNSGAVTGAAGFTFNGTATLTLGVATSSTGILVLSGSTSSTVTIKPLAAAGGYTLTLPIDDGDVNEVLSTDGSGNLSWTTGGSGGSGTVNTGAALRGAYYPSAGTTVDDWAGIEFNNTNLNTKIISQATTSVILELRMAASQSADGFVIKNSSSNNIVQIQKDGKMLLTSDASATLQNPDGFDHVFMTYGGGNSRLVVASGSGYDHRVIIASGPVTAVYGGVDGGFVGMETNNALNLVTNKITRITIAAGGGVTVADLAGTGSRAVLTDANGLLSAPVSDRSVKQNIQSLNYGLNTIMQLNPVSFEYKDGWKNYGQGTQIGFIAQDIQRVMPNSVFTTPSTGKMGYNEIDMIPVLVKAMQEQQEQIDGLRKEINILKDKR